MLSLLAAVFLGVNSLVERLRLESRGSREFDPHAE